MKAAVLYAKHQPLRVEEVDLDPPRPREVLVKMAASGVCHSDLHYIKGGREHPTLCRWCWATKALAPSQRLGRR